MLSAGKDRAFLVLGSVCLLVTVSLQWLYVGHEATSHNAKVWFSDGGLLLLTAQRLLDGAVLYRDVFYQYGPLHIFAWTGWAYLFGNTIDSYFGFLNVASTIDTVLLLLCLRKTGCSVTETGITLAASIPYFLLPGSSCAGFYEHGYLAFERMLFLVLVLVWKAPSDRRFVRSCTLGAIIGLMQTVKFGNAAGALAGLLCVDLFSMGSAWNTPAWRALWRHVIGIGAGFTAVIVIFTLALYSCMPGEIARDVLWPYFMANSYVLAPIDRLPRWLTLNYFVGTQLSAVIAVLFGIVTLGFLSIRFLGFGNTRVSERLPAGKESGLPLVILLVAFLVNALLIYKQIWLFYQSVWMVTVSIGFLVRRVPVSGKLALAILCIPCLSVTVRQVIWPPLRQNEEPVKVPNGETIWMDSAVSQQNAAVCESLRLVPPENGKVFVLDRGPVTLASHLHFFYKIPQAARHTMIFPGWLRPLDYGKLLQGLETTKAVVLIQRPGDPPPGKFIAKWDAYDFPPEFSRQFSARLDSPIRAGESCWIFPVIGRGH